MAQPAAGTIGMHREERIRMPVDKPDRRYLLADQIAANIKAANRVVSKATDMAADRLAQDIRNAETSQKATAGTAS
jgi:hypothetical protein